MIDPTPNERHAMKLGGQAGGEFLNSIGVTDLATMTVDQWDTFISCVVGGYTEQLSGLDDEIPF